MIKRLAILVFMLFIAPAQASIQGYEAEYQLRWHGLSVGTSLHSVKQIAATRYVATSKSFPKARFLPFHDFERSEFTVHNDQVRPLRYDFQTQDNRKKLKGHLLFDWDKRQVLKTVNGHPPVHEALLDFSHDKITHFFQLRQDLKAGEKELNYTVIEPKKINHWKIRVLGSEPLKTPLGLLNTVKLEHVSDNQERRTQFWLAPDLDYLMVKLVQIRKGKKTAEVFIQHFKPQY